MSHLFFSSAFQRPNAILGSPHGHPQGRDLVHWMPGLGSDAFTEGAAFIGAYCGFQDVMAGMGMPKEAFDFQKAQIPDVGGTVFYLPDTANSQSCGVFVPHPTAFQGEAAGGRGASVAVWMKHKVHLPTNPNLTGFGALNRIGTGVLNTHYPYTDGTAYFGVLRGDRISFTPPADVDRTQLHHVCVTHTGYVWRCYINGTLAHEDLTGDGHVYLGNGGSAYVSIGGSWSEGAYTHNGWSCDWRVYSRALSPGDVRALCAPESRWSLYYGGQ